MNSARADGFAFCHRVGSGHLEGGRSFAEIDLTLFGTIIARNCSDFPEMVRASATTVCLDPLTICPLRGDPGLLRKSCDPIDIPWVHIGRDAVATHA